MRKALIVAVLSALCVVNANAFEQGGVVVSVDPASETFTVRWATADRAYKTSDRTIIRVGQKMGAWSDLKIGAKVHVTYQPLGETRVASEVQILP